MVSKALLAAALAAALSCASEAQARRAAPLVPTALVEDVKSATADVEFMDYVGTGQLIKLQPRDVLVLSYLKSCEHKTITGGTVAIGAERSDVQGGKVARVKVRCDGGKVQLTAQQANASGASSFRLQSVDPDRTLYALPPVIQLPRSLNDGRTMVIERTDRIGQRFEIEIDQGLAGGALFDLARVKVAPLTPGATYSASLGGRKITFKVDAKAKSTSKSGKVPVISRLLRLTPG